MWALLGLILIVGCVLCFIVSIIAACVPKWFKHKGLTPQRIWIFTALFSASICLQAAIFAIMQIDTGGSYWVELVIAFIFLCVSTAAFEKAYQPTGSLEQKPLTTPVVQPIITATESSPQPVLPILSETDNISFEQRLDEIIRAIIADDVVSIDEVRYLCEWLSDKPSDGNIGYLRSVLNEYLKDGELSEAEEADLLRQFRNLVGVSSPVRPKVIITPNRPTPTTKKPTHQSQVFNLQGLTLKFSYTDATGEYSRRHVKVQKDNIDRIYAYCHDRRAMRTFIKHRMSNAVDAETGEVLSV